LTLIHGPRAPFDEPIEDRVTLGLPFGMPLDADDGSATQLDHLRNSVGGAAGDRESDTGPIDRLMMP
jgi:hypothetical protein